MRLCHRGLRRTGSTTTAGRSISANQGRAFLREGRGNDLPTGSYSYTYFEGSTSPRSAPTKVGLCSQASILSWYGRVRPTYCRPSNRYTERLLPFTHGLLLHVIAQTFGRFTRTRPTATLYSYHVVSHGQLVPFRSSPICLDVTISGIDSQIRSNSRTKINMPGRPVPKTIYRAPCQRYENCVLVLHQPRDSPSVIFDAPQRN